MTIPSARCAAGRNGLAAYFAAGDPDPEASLALLRGLPAAGADVIELGMPFSDPVADGPILQQANARALAGGQTLKRTPGARPARDGAGRRWC